MADYRIRVESIDGSEIMDEKYVKGIECDGFVILGDRGENGICCVHKMSKMGIAKMILACDDMMDSAKLAFIFRDVTRKYAEDDKVDFLRRVVDSLGGGMDDE